MYIKASASLRNDYAAISELAKKINEPIYLPKKGEGDMVLMSIEKSAFPAVRAAAFVKPAKCFVTERRKGAPANEMRSENFTVRMGGF